ncbi:MAG: gliding motility-associated C-terminal domain-containing protein, partial [Pedobacter sp.]
AGSCSVTSTGNTITMKPAPAPPTVSASPNPAVSGSTTVITATGCTSRAFWFDKAVETTAMFAYLGMDSSSPYNYTSAEISQVKTYYVACQSAYPNLCYSTRTPITINVDATGAPNAPTLTSSENNICFISGSQILLTASNCSGIVRWYNSPTSQNPLETDNGAPYEYSFSPSAQTYTYYADCRVNGVLSTTRSTINVVIKPIPTPPTLSPGSLFINSGSNISIYTSNCPGGIVKWYDSYQNGNLLFTGDTYSQNNVTTSLSLYASCTVNDCESSYRNSISINVSNQVQAPNLYSASQTICGSGSKVIEAIGCSNGTVKWYDTHQNGNLLATGQTFTTPILTYIVNGNNSYTYYADCTINGITSSSRSSVYISVYPASNTPTANNVTIACNATATLTASGCNSSESFTVQVAEDYKLIANNILTPNGDGVNDTWIVQNIDMYPSNEVRIFDRNGREMYNKKSYDNSWNGTIGGNDLAEGTYYYIITYGPNKLVQKGFITIIRNR